MLHINCGVIFLLEPVDSQATRQSDLEKSIAKTLETSGLKERDVTPFMRVRVVGLTGIDYQEKGRSKEGIITIWNPTEKQVRCTPSSSLEVTLPVLLVCSYF